MIFRLLHEFHNFLNMLLLDIVGHTFDSANRNLILTGWSTVQVSQVIARSARFKGRSVDNHFILWFFSQYQINAWMDNKGKAGFLWQNILSLAYRLTGKAWLIYPSDLPFLQKCLLGIESYALKTLMQHSPRPPFFE